MIEKQMRIFVGAKPFVTVTHFDGVGKYGNHTHEYYEVTKASRKRIAKLFNKGNFCVSDYRTTVFCINDDMTPSVELRRI